MPAVAASCRGREAPTATEVCVVYVAESHGGRLMMFSSFWLLRLSRYVDRCVSTSPELCDRGSGATILCHLTAAGATIGAGVHLFEEVSDELRAVMRMCSAFGVVLFMLCVLRLLIHLRSCVVVVAWVGTHDMLRYLLP